MNDRSELEGARRLRLDACVGKGQVWRADLVALALACCAFAGGPAAQVPAEEIARRQYESGLAFARNGNYTEALKDFQAVVELHPTTAVAPKAWLQIGLYHLERAGDLGAAEAAADTILKKYPTSDAVAGAHILTGRATIARSRRPADLTAAVASFDRVLRLFPDSAAVPEAFVHAGDALHLLGQPDEALERYHRVLIDHPEDAWAAAAGLGAGMALAARGDAPGAMEQFQRVRNRWPESREAGVALKRQTILYRLTIRAQSGQVFSLRGELPEGAAKRLQLRALLMTPDDVLYYATNSGVGALMPPTAERPPGATRPRGLALDAGGEIVVIEEGTLRPKRGAPLALAIPRAGRTTPQALERIDAAVALPTGQWLVAAASEGAILRFTRRGEYEGPFSSAGVTRLAISLYAEVAALERETRTVLIFSAEGKLAGRIPARGPRYTLKNPRDVAYDAFGHLYVLDEAAVAIFDRQRQLVHLFSEPERSRGALRDASALAVDSAGRLYVADDAAGRVRIYQ